MLQYPTPSDLCYGNVANTTMPQGGTQWGPGCLESSYSTPSDSMFFHSPSYDSAGYFPTDGPLCSPLEGLHQHSLVSVPYDTCLAHYDHYAQPPSPPALPSSSFSELGHALVETPLPESRPIDHGSFALPSLAMPSPSAPKHTHDLFRLVQDPTTYPVFPPPPASKQHPPPSLAIPGTLAYSPRTRIQTLRSSSFSSSDIVTPTSSVHLVDLGATSPSQALAPLAPSPKAGQGVLKLPSTKRSARCKPVIACFFCRERKIACQAPPVGSADPTCNQCARRSRKCEYPTMSLRGLHKRRASFSCTSPPPTPTPA